MRRCHELLARTAPEAASPVRRICGPDLAILGSSMAAAAGFGPRSSPLPSVPQERHRAEPGSSHAQLGGLHACSTWQTGAKNARRPVGPKHLTTHTATVPPGPRTVYLGTAGTRRPSWATRSGCTLSSAIG